MLNKLESTTPRVVLPEQAVPEQPQGQLQPQEQAKITSSSITGQLLDSSKAINPIFTAQQAIKNETSLKHQNRLPLESFTLDFFRNHNEALSKI